MTPSTTKLENNIVKRHKGKSDKSNYQYLVLEMEVVVSAHV
jgi:hypothetical protein